MSIRPNFLVSWTCLATGRGGLPTITRKKNSATQAFARVVDYVILRFVSCLPNGSSFFWSDIHLASFGDVESFIEMRHAA